MTSEISGSLSGQTGTMTPETGGTVSSEMGGTMITEIAIIVL